MELACDILKRSKEETKKEIEMEDDINLKFQKLGLNSISTPTDFLNSIKKEKYICCTKALLEQYFQNVDDDMVNAIQMSYCLSSFSNEIFDSYKSRFEQKLIVAANKVMIAIDKLIKNSEPPSEFYNIIDNYLSLYKVWKSQDSINVLTKLFEEIQKELKIIKLQKKKGLNINLSKSEELIDKLFLENPKYATRILLHNYNIFSDSQDIEKYFWNCVQNTCKKYWDIIFVTLVAELKIHLIPFLTDPCDRKKIYYSLDTENLIQKISNNELTSDVVHNIMIIFSNKIKKINSKFIFETIDEDSIPSIVKLFESFYHEVLKKIT